MVLVWSLMVCFFITSEGYRLHERSPVKAQRQEKDSKLDLFSAQDERELNGVIDLLIDQIMAAHHIKPEKTGPTDEDVIFNERDFEFIFDEAVDILSSMISELETDNRDDSMTF